MPPRPFNAVRSGTRAGMVALMFVMAACATPPRNPTAIALHAAQVYGPQCETDGPTNTQAWGNCIARTYNRAVARHGDACTSWQLTSRSYEDCVIDASVRAGAGPVSASPGPYCIALNPGGDINYSRCN